MLSLHIWMRIAGVLYLIMCAAALMGTPIRAEGPSGLLESAKSGDPGGRYLVTTWVTLGLLLGILGASLLWFSRMPDQARALAWTAVAIELAWGIPVDVIKIARGHKKAPSLVWILIHAAVGTSGLIALGAG